MFGWGSCLRVMERIGIELISFVWFGLKINYCHSNANKECPKWHTKKKTISLTRIHALYIHIGRVLYPTDMIRRPLGMSEGNQNDTGVERWKSLRTTVKFKIFKKVKNIRGEKYKFIHKKTQP